MIKVIALFFARVVCRIKRRHTYDFMKAHSGKFHQFYRINGGGRQCICPRCGMNVILK